MNQVLPKNNIELIVAIMAPLFNSLSEISFAAAWVFIFGPPKEGSCIYSYRPESGILLNGYQKPGSNVLQFEVVFDMERLFSLKGGAYKPRWSDFFLLGQTRAILLFQKLNDCRQWAQVDMSKCRTIIYTKPNPFYKI